MNQQTIPNVTLFDLLARNWQRPAPVRQLCFNEDDTILAINSADGAVALARIGDNEPPDPTFGPLGNAERLNWLVWKKRNRKVSSHFAIVARSYSFRPASGKSIGQNPASRSRQACQARKAIFEGLRPWRTT